MQVVSVLVVGLSYGARNVLSYNRRLMQNFLAFIDSPILPLRRSPKITLHFWRHHFEGREQRSLKGRRRGGALRPAGKKAASDITAAVSFVRSTATTSLSHRKAFKVTACGE